MTNATLDSAIIRIQAVLNDLHLPYRVLRAQKGPVLTRYFLESVGPLNVAMLSDARAALARVLDVQAVSIEAPIPGTSLIGLDIPHDKPELVSHAELFASPAMAECTSPLAFPLGKGVTGDAVICDLGKMPHLLITGVAGSGKSACIESMLLSLLRRNSPDELRLVLFDPHNEYPRPLINAPHMLTPVITDERRAADLLNEMVEEMVNRFQQLHNAEVRTIAQLNQQVPENERLPRIVIVLDGLDALMATFPQEIETAIARLAQQGRAAGIHLVAAAQRTRPDVLTGLIRANIPSHISFRVPTEADSKALFHQSGAEMLLRAGDMLYMPANEFLPIRVQGCSVSSEEHNSLTEAFRMYSPRGYSTPLPATPRA